MLKRMRLSVCVFVSLTVGGMERDIGDIIKSHVEPSSSTTYSSNYCVIVIN